MKSGLTKADAPLGRYITRIARTPARESIIAALRKRNFSKETTDTEIAQFIWEVAFLIPEQISTAINCLARYRDAEGLSDQAPLDQFTAAAAMRLRKVKRKLRT